jgi:hypothetical protein
MQEKKIMANCSTSVIYKLKTYKSKRKKISPTEDLSGTEVCDAEFWLNKKVLLLLLLLLFHCAIVLGMTW